MNIFSSLKILDLTRVFSGPFATRHFSDFGAEVIKVEPPQGDDSRNFPPFVQNWSGYFELVNRNKKSLVLDLKNPADLKILYKLCETCDVFVENFSPQVKKKLKIDYEVISRLNKGIIYASLSGVSETINKKYYDVIAQAESGFMSLNGENEDMKVSTSIIDAFSGMKLAYAITAALYDREKTRSGCHVSVSMKGSAFDLLEQNLLASSITKKNPQKVSNMDSAIAPFGVFKTKDGAIVLAIGNENQWQEFSLLLLSHNPAFDKNSFKSNSLRLKNICKLKFEIENMFKTCTSIHLIKILEAKHISCGQVKTMLHVLYDKENYTEKLLEKIEHPIAGKIVVPTGGIFFSHHKKERYKKAPELNKSKRHGI